jgi:hypothetical protein
VKAQQLPILAAILLANCSSRQPASEAPDAGCGFILTVPDASHVDCPISTSCASTYAEQMATINREAGICNSVVPTQVMSGACGTRLLWRQVHPFSSTFECIYTSSGVLAGSESCGDTGCLWGGDIVDDATICGDGGLGPNQCPTLDGGA